MDFSVAHRGQVRLTCRHLGISTATFYRWWRRFGPRRPESLEDDWRDRRPNRVRQPQTAAELVATIRPCMGAVPAPGQA